MDKMNGQINCYKRIHYMTRYFFCKQEKKCTVQRQIKTSIDKCTDGFSYKHIERYACAQIII